MDYHLADTIVSATIVNIVIKSRKKGIYLDQYDENKPGYKYFLEIAKMTRDVYQLPLYVDMSFFKYWKFRLVDWKKNKGINRFNSNKIEDNEIKVIDPDFYLTLMAEEFQVPLDYFDLIYEEYYKKNK